MKEKNKQSGFTLIELLVVVAIIGILAAIAIPQFAAYRSRGFDARSNSDCRNAATAMEAFFVDNNTYVGATPGTLPGFVQSADVSVTLQNLTATSFRSRAPARRARGITCTWTSNPGAGAPNMVCRLT